MCFFVEDLIVKILMRKRSDPHSSIVIMSPFQTLIYFTHQDTPHMKKKQKNFKMAQSLMMKEFDVHICGNTVWISHDKAEYQKISFTHELVGKMKYIIACNKNVSFN